jgi:hypothetical protein
MVSRRTVCPEDMSIGEFSTGDVPFVEYGELAENERVEQ